MESSASVGLFRYSVSHPLPPSYILPPASFWQQDCNVAEAGEGEQVCAVSRGATLCDSARSGWAELGKVVQEPFALLWKGDTLNPLSAPS